MSPLDADMLLRDGLVDLDNAEAVAVSETRNDDGAVVIDLKKTGSRGVVVVMNLPATPSAAGDALAAVIQSSDYVSTDFKTLANFPTLYALNRLLTIKATTAFVASDIGRTATGTTTADTGVIRWYDRALETVGGVGSLIVTSDAAGDLFDDVDEIITATSGSGVGTMNGEAAPATERLSFGNYAILVRTEKRYIRYSGVPDAGSNWGKALVGITNDWDYPLADH